MGQCKAQLSFDPSILAYDKVKQQVWSVAQGLRVVLPSCWERRSVNNPWGLTFCSKGSPWGLKPPVTSPSSWSCLPGSQLLPEILGRRRREREKKGQTHQKFNPPQGVQMQNLKMYRKQSKAPWSICLMFIQFWILFLANGLFSLWSERAGTACQAFEDFRTVHGRLYLKDGSNAKASSLHPKSQVKNVRVQLMKNGGICIHFHTGVSCICSFLERKASWELSVQSLLLCTLPSFISVLLLLLLLFVPCKVATEVLALRFEVLVSWMAKPSWIWAKSQQLGFI